MVVVGRDIPSLLVYSDYRALAVLSYPNGQGIETKVAVP